MSRNLKSVETLMLNSFNKQFTLEEMKNVKQVSMTMKEETYCIADPVVYKIPGTKSLLIFGEVRRMFDIEAIKKALGSKYKPAEKMDDEEKPQGKKLVVDETRFNESDVELIMSQISLPRDDVLKALIESDYDVVNAMMKLMK